MLNAGKVNRRILLASDAVTGALLLMITDNAANGRHGIVLEQNLSCLNHLSLLEQLDNLWN